MQRERGQDKALLANQQLQYTMEGQDTLDAPGASTIRQTWRKKRKKCDFYYYGETSEFSMSMVSTTTKHFIRKIRDDMEIVAGIRDILMNSKEEILQAEPKLCF